MIESDRFISGSAISDDHQDQSLRPGRLQDYAGQPAVREQMGIFIDAAKSRQEVRCLIAAAHHISHR